MGVVQSFFRSWFVSLCRGDGGFKPSREDAREILESPSGNRVRSAPEEFVGKARRYGFVAQVVIVLGP